MCLFVSYHYVPANQHAVETKMKTVESFVRFRRFFYKNLSLIICRPEHIFSLIFIKKTAELVLEIL
jgi:hypothetical protein